MNWWPEFFGNTYQYGFVGWPRLSPVLNWVIVETPSHPRTFTLPKYGCRKRHAMLVSVVQQPSAGQPVCDGNSGTPLLSKSYVKKMIVGSFEVTVNTTTSPSLIGYDSPEARIVLN